MAHVHWVTGGELGKGRGEPQWTVHCPQRGQQHNAGDGPGLKIRGQEVVPGPQSSQQQKQRPGAAQGGARQGGGELVLSECNIDHFGFPWLRARHFVFHCARWLTTP